ncbi:transmembrane protein 154 isoform 2-T2 [Polymixia lowei]
MSACRPGNMRRARWEMTPLLLLILLTSLAGRVLCQSEADEVVDEPESYDELTPEPILPDGDIDYSVLPTDYNIDDITTTHASPSPDSSPGLADDYATEGSGGDFWAVTDGDNPSSEPGDEGLSLTIILVPVVLVVVIIAMVVCGIVINRRWNQKMNNTNQKQDDSYLDGCSTEKVPMPMFEEDVPSVLELEMDELDQWMNTDGGDLMECKQI